jgi:hypothetical protein
MAYTKDCLKVPASTDIRRPVSDQVSDVLLITIKKSYYIYYIVQQTKKCIFLADVQTLRQTLVCTICSKILFICLRFSNVQEGALCTVQ